MNQFPGFTLYHCQEATPGNQGGGRVMAGVQQVPGPQEGSKQEAANSGNSMRAQGLNVAKDFARENKAEVMRVSKLYEDRERELIRFNTRMERNNVIKLLTLASSEAENMGNLKRAKESGTLDRPRLEQDENLAMEMSRLKAQEMINAKQSQLLREGSVELRSLELKLRGAYTARELEAQLREKKAKRIQEKNRDKINYKILRDNWDQLEEFDNRRECQEMHRKINLRRDLQDQMITQEEAKQDDYHRTLQDRAVVDKIMQKVREEDQQAWQDRMDSMARNRRDLELFKEAQRLWMAKEKAVIEEENNRVMAYINKQDTDVQTRMEERGERVKEKERLTDQTARRTYERELNRQRSDDLRQEFLELTLRENQQRKDREDFESAQRKRKDLRETHHRQMQERVGRQRQAALEDKEHRQRLMQDIEDNARQGQRLNEQLQERKQQFRAEMQKTIEHRRIQRAEEMQKVCLEDEQLAGTEKSRVQLIEEERLRLLKEHAAQLMGYFPRGVLRATDLPLLGEEFTRQYTGQEG